MSQQNPPQKEGQQDEPKQQQQQLKKPTGWYIELNSICGSGNGQKALKVRKREVIQFFFVII
jgi:hypothetical protein